jgi:hypothetical protein
MKRIEELRSRLAQIETSLLHIDINIRQIYESYDAKKITPPILYPRILFEEVRNWIDSMKLGINEIDPSNYREISKKLEGLSTDMKYAMDFLSNLQYLHDQRVSGLHNLKTIEYQPTLQSEYSMLNKVYNAVDALSYELTCNIFGNERVNEMKYIPVSLFSGSYATQYFTRTTTPSSIITIPYYDCFRARFWTGLAHEIAHSWIALSLQENKSLAKYIDKEANKLRKILFSDVSDPVMKYVLKYNLSLQLVELVSDFISAYVCGPASIFAAFTMLNVTSQVDANAINNILRESTHPPIEIRISGMQKILELLNLPSSYQHLDDAVSGAKLFLYGRHILEENFSSQIFDYREEVDIFASKIEATLRRKKMVPFDNEKWNAVIDSIEDGAMDSLTPIQLMNAIWFRRLEKNVCDCNLDIEDFLCKRRDEKKLFEMTVHHMYRYYEDIVKRTSEYDYS